MHEKQGMTKYARAARCAAAGLWAAVSIAFGADRLAGAAEVDVGPEAQGAPAWTLVVMDPLAKPLSCPCVAGYAQRDYEVLAERLGRRLGREVRVVFDESLATALEGGAAGAAQLVIGKQSVVEHDAERCKLVVTPLARLTGKDGAVTQTGLAVVPAADPAQTVADLAGYRVFFGPAECDEKHAAALALWQEQGIPAPGEIETAAACDEGALAILELAPPEQGCAVISSYAKPLLEGCGTIEKGALRVVGETRPVGFIAAYATEHLTERERRELTEALLSISADPLLRIKLESREGFVAYDPLDGEAPARGCGGRSGFRGRVDSPANVRDGGRKKKLTPTAIVPRAADEGGPAAETPLVDPPDRRLEWTGWRGAERTASVAWLPERLPAEASFRWEKRLASDATVIRPTRSTSSAACRPRTAPSAGRCAIRPRGISTTATPRGRPLWLPPRR